MNDPEDELLMAVAVLSKDIRDAQISVSKGESMLADIDNKIARQNVIYKATLEAFINVSGAQVVNLSEYRSLKSGLKITTKELEDLNKKRAQIVEIRNKELAKIPALNRQLQEKQDELDRYEPPRKVLEFPRRDQQ